MEFNRDGQPSIRPPILNWSNYRYWKVGMRAYLKFINEQVWIAVMNSWYTPIYIVNDKLVEKSIESWDKVDYQKVGWTARQ